MIKKTQIKNRRSSRTRGRYLMHLTATEAEAAIERFDLRWRERARKAPVAAAIR